MIARLGAFLQQGSPLAVGGMVLVLVVVITMLPILWTPYVLFIGAAIALRGLSRRPLEAAAPVLIAAVAGAILVLFAGFPEQVYLPLALLMLGPMLVPLLLAQLYRALGLSLTLLLGFCASWVLTQLLTLAGLTPDWDAMLQPLAELHPQLHAQFLDRGGREMMEALGLQMFVGGGAVTGIATLLFGRSWQAKIAGTHDFRAEFRAINFGKYVAIAYLLLLVPAWMYGITAPALFGLFLVLTMAFTFQATGTIHEIAGTLEPPASIILLAVFYLSLLFFHQLALMLCTLSALDKLFGLRARLPLP